VLFEFVDHIADRFRLEDEVVRALGADRLPTDPTRIIGGARGFSAPFPRNTRARERSRWSGE
jgi:hypothetical protein